MAFIVGNMSDLEFAKHILDAAYLMDGLYEEAVSTVKEAYGEDILLEAWQLHLDTILEKLYGEEE